MPDTSPTRGMSIEEKLSFYSFPEPNSGCWLWIGHVNACGYGKLTLRPKTFLAHRLAWLVYRGPLTSAACVCHRCDQPCCVNPDHLFLGSHTENMRDMLRKGRKVSTLGSNHPGARLTEGKVREILGDKRKHREIAASFGVATSTISMIKVRKNWSHVT